MYARCSHESLLTRYDTGRVCTTSHCPTHLSAGKPATMWCVGWGPYTSPPPPYPMQNLREYVADINALASSDGIPMLRPMFLMFPNDPVCATGMSDVIAAHVHTHLWCFFAASPFSVTVPPVLCCSRCDMQRTSRCSTCLGPTGWWPQSLCTGQRPKR